MENAGKRGESLIVAIAGGSGSGKTVFAERLVRRLGSRAVALSHDDYYKHLPDMTAQEAETYDFDSPSALDTHVLVEHICSLKAGRAIQVPSYDFATHARTEGARRIEPAAVVVVEGLLIMCDPELRNLFDLTVFIDVDPDVRVLRRVERDCRTRGASLERAIAMYLGTTKSAHEKYVEPFKNRADIVIPDALSDCALEIVARGIEGCIGQ